LVYLWVLAIDQRHFADDLNQVGRTGLAQFCDGTETAFAVEDVELDLDQLMIAQCAFKLCKYTFSQTIVSHDQYRFQMVANGFVLFLLLWSERHNLTSASDLLKAAASLPERVRDRPVNHDSFIFEVPRGPFQDKP
ncbi:hypothetical protein ALQ56_04382, partial [Pseudomonas syringae pv. papulans]